MKTKKILKLLSDEVNEKIFINTVKSFNEPTIGIRFYQWKLNQPFDYENGLCGFFVFSSTPENCLYWNELNKTLLKIILTK